MSAEELLGEVAYRLGVEMGKAGEYERKELYDTQEDFVVRTLKVGRVPNESLLFKVWVKLLEVETIRRAGCSPNKESFEFMEQVWKEHALPWARAHGRYQEGP